MTTPNITTVPDDIHALIVVLEKDVDQAQAQMISELLALSGDPDHEPLLITINEESKS
jgi:hypothetical protein